MNKALLKEAGTINHRHHEVMDRLEKIIDEGKSYKTMADLASMLKVSLRTLYEIAPSKDELINLTINNVLTKHGKIAMEKIHSKPSLASPEDASNFLSDLILSGLIEKQHD